MTGDRSLPTVGRAPARGEASRRGVVDGRRSLSYVAALTATPDEDSMKKAKPLPHRNRSKSARHRAKLKAKHKRVRQRVTRGERSTYR